MLIDTLLSQLAPHECLGCAAEGRLLCERCSQQLLPVPAMCYRCRKLSGTHKTCSSCRAHTDLYAVHAGVMYEGLAKDLVWQLKFRGAQAAAREIADLLAGTIANHPDIVIVPVSTATSRVRQRGYDQAKLIARALAARTGVLYFSGLRRHGQHHQVGSNRAQRTHQLADAYWVARPERLAGKHVILVDDVMTTGATLEAAARVVKAAGAHRVSGLVFARA